MSSIQTEFDEFFQCFEIQDPLETEIESVRIALNENPQNALSSTRAHPKLTDSSLDDDGMSYLAVNIKKNWQPGRTLKIKFLSGEPKLHDKVKQYANRWLLYANLKFLWLPKEATKADIRIDFVQGAGSSSIVGTGALREKDQTVRTMNLDINLSNSDEFIRRKVLHEFGHVLGCVHEHQSPLANFEWNKELIYEELSKSPNYWSSETVDKNVINRFKMHEVRASAYDGDSIMLYQYPAHWFKNNGGMGTKNNTTLSARDKAHIANMYPASSNDIGSFSTVQIRSYDTASTEPDSNDVAFEPAYAEPPAVAVGLSWLDLDFTTDISILATAEDVSDDHFTVVIAPRSGSKVFSAACSWLEASASEPEVKIGQWNLASTSNDKGQAAGGKASKTIKFDSRFIGSDPPIVVVWFSGLSLGKDAGWRVKTYATNISPFKFKLHVETTGDTDLRDATVTWVAIPAGKEGITAGTFSTNVPGIENSGLVDFSQANFETAPAVMMAISGLDFECGRNLRLRVSNSDLTKDGMMWHLDSWLDSAMNTATGSYVAVSGPKIEDEI